MLMVISSNGKSEFDYGRVRVVTQQADGVGF